MSIRLSEIGLFFVLMIEFVLSALSPRVCFSLLGIH